MRRILSLHRQFLEKISFTNENIEDTLLNVLLAIRQNEYLQAWYPAQKGHPEMKVIGSHPSSARAEEIAKKELNGELYVY